MKKNNFSFQIINKNTFRKFLNLIKNNKNYKKNN